MGIGRKVEPAVLIDGAVPRTPKERAAKLWDYLHGLAPEAWERFRGDFDNALKDDDEPGNGGEWSEIEEEIIEQIEAALPPRLVILVGEQQPGDVVIVEGRINDMGDTVPGYYEPPEDRVGTIFDPTDETFGPIMAAIQAGDFEVARGLLKQLVWREVGLPESKASSSIPGRAEA